MSDRDCGRWYCQGPAGFRELEEGIDVLIWPGTPAAADNRGDLLRERGEITGNPTTEAWPEGKPLEGWMGEMESEGFAGWLAGPGHEDGAANNYWVWDPDSRGMYMEYRRFSPGGVPRDFGELHDGVGWQLPLLAVFDGEPTMTDLAELEEVGVPFVVQFSDDEEEPWEEPVDIGPMISLLEEVMLSAINASKVAKEAGLGEVTKMIRRDITRPLRKLIKDLR